MMGILIHGKAVLILSWAQAIIILGIPIQPSQGIVLQLEPKWSILMVTYGPSLTGILQALVVYNDKLLRS